jgi:hypothetical protein
MMIEMNIFRLDDDPVLCASWHNDKHVVKMILESCQLLSTAHRVHDGLVTQIRSPKNGRRLWHWALKDSVQDKMLYQATHVNHPCAVWCRSSRDAYRWLWALTRALATEYTHRYGRIHKCESDGLIVWLQRAPAWCPSVGITEPPQAMPDRCKVPGNPVEAYRNYYRQEKRHLATWKARSIPAWFY